jgi:c-di-GMP-binding flagellar brake protein YcgR
MSSERRNEPRVRRNDEVIVEWSDASYDRQEIRAKCIDLSATGMRLRLDHPLPAGQYIQFSLPSGDFRGSATVRFVRPEGGHFVAGLRFGWQMKTNAA